MPERKKTTAQRKAPQKHNNISATLVNPDIKKKFKSALELVDYRKSILERLIVLDHLAQHLNEFLADIQPRILTVDEDSRSEPVRKQAFAEIQELLLKIIKVENRRLKALDEFVAKKLG